ncbi:DNA-(apurinic or apyrimidinic site) lyase /endonuclease III [Hathewaya proteolytica DSM 3090]|uniref:Endonuclease III n=1 Tax=Hathewaya proteolytica DSM 3090 TaxID=1121331 RepID=A0A1M6RNY3_9CLOT|nr:endonuclease III [Hathewaya proteolytica]SHK34163.1 DNA-(apurinic or apyrimidinic site) lyase /endonuclease III [Hathewaya proteolytica DSM 3090]
MEKEKIDHVIKILEETYSDAKCALDFKSPYELMVSTILSAQCTDERVNKVCGELYKKYNTPYKMVELTVPQLTEKIKSCGLSNNKSKNILGASRMLIENFHGEVPSSMEELTSLPGVGIKTANVVLSNAFNVPAIAVDTHVFRVSKRIGLSSGKNVEIVEEDLMKIIPKDKWSHMHHCLIWHGRKICKARKPLCDECPIKGFCIYFEEENNNK